MKNIIFTILLMFSVSAVADDNIIQKAEDALNNFSSATGMFKQYNGDGSIFTGEFWIQKPGKIRFEYSYPNKNFIVSNGSFIFFWDEDLQQQTNAPLSYTPAGVILQEDIKFGDEIKVKSVTEEGKILDIEVFSAENEDLGVIALRFLKDGDNLILNQWKVTDVSGSETIISLENVKFTEIKDKNIFRFKDPRRDPFKLN